MTIHYVYDIWKALPLCGEFPYGITMVKGLVTCVVCEKLLKQDPPIELFDEREEEDAWAYLSDNDTQYVFEDEEL